MFTAIYIEFFSLHQIDLKLTTLSKIGSLWNAEPSAFDVVIIFAIDPYDWVPAHAAHVGLIAKFFCNSRKCWCPASAVAGKSPGREHIGSGLILPAVRWDRFSVWHIVGYITHMLSKIPETFPEFFLLWPLGLGMPVNKLSRIIFGKCLPFINCIALGTKFYR